MTREDVYLPSTNRVTSGLDMDKTAGFCYARDGCNGLLHPTAEVHNDRPVFECDVCGRRFVKKVT